MTASECDITGPSAGSRSGRPTPHRVRVDAVGSVAVEAGLLGAAVAAGIVDVLTAGGRRYENGRTTEI